MHPFLRKLRLIYLPFLILAVAVPAVYTLLDWLLVIRTGLEFSVPDILVMYVLPLVVAGVAVMLWLGPRFGLLDFELKDTALTYQVVAALAIAAPTIAAQHFLFKASGDLTGLDNISSIASHEPARYYLLEQCFVDRNAVGVYATEEVSGRRNDYNDFSLFFVLPILADPSDTLGSSVHGWMAFKYFRSIHNKKGPETAKKEWERFERESYEQFNALDLQSLRYFERVGNNPDHDNWQKAMSQSPRYGASDTAPILVPMTSSFDQRSAASLTVTVVLFGVGSVLMLLCIAFPPLDEQALKRSETDKPLKAGAAMARSDLGEIVRTIVPRRGYIVTPLLFDAIILIFILMVGEGLGFKWMDAEGLIDWGANYGPMTREGEWWRLLTSMFLHGGVMHLAGNLVGLALVGKFLEAIFGWWRLAILYVASGIVAGLASVWLNDDVVSVGASGAIFGLYGTVLMLLLAKSISSEFGTSFLITAVGFAAFNLIMGLIPGSGIDNVAHVGGLVAGFFIGGVFEPFIRKAALVQLEEEAAMEAANDEG